MLIYDIKKHFVKSDLDTEFISSLVIPAGEKVNIQSGDTGFGYAVGQSVEITKNGQMKVVDEGMFFSVPGPAKVTSFYGMLALRHNYSGFSMSGGPLEKLGRLKYIDGCSDTLLLAPMLKGDPCLNFLYVPPNINQTAHTHPSVRIGMVVSGEGYCRADGKNNTLNPNCIFVLEPDEIHSFHTVDKHLRIIVFHPDSDFGPTNDSHPMLNRSYVEGMSLQGDNKYRTKNITEFTS